MNIFDGLELETGPPTTDKITFLEWNRVKSPAEKRARELLYAAVKHDKDERAMLRNAKNVFDLERGSSEILAMKSNMSLNPLTLFVFTTEGEVGKEGRPRQYQSAIRKQRDKIMMSNSSSWLFLPIISSRMRPDTLLVTGWSQI